MLHKQLLALPDDERLILRDSLEGQIADLRRLWGPHFSPFQLGTIEELERIEFVLRHRDKFLHSGEPGVDKPYFLCRKCEVPIIIDDLANLCCPGCGTADWLELVFA